jgi:hypothetical protein
MSLRGDLRTMPLPDVLQWVGSGRKTGTLHVARRSIRKRILLREGRIYSSWSNDPRESLGQFLVRLRLVSEEQLFRALLAQEREGRLLGSILVSQGALSEDDLKRALEAKATETIYDLFLWPAGEFEFLEGELPADIRVTLETPVTPVILEGIRRVDEWQRFRTIFPTSATTFSVVPGSAPSDPLESEIVTLAGAGATLAAISLELRRSEFDTAEVLFDLYGRGLVSVADAGFESEASDPIGAAQELLELANRRLEERRFDAAIQAYEDVIAIDRLNQHAKKGLLAAREARERHARTTSVARHKIPRIAVDLATLTRQNLDPQEGFVLSRVNGQWDVQSILKLCPMGEDEALLIFSRLLDRNLIELS